MGFSDSFFEMTLPIQEEFGYRLCYVDMPTVMEFERFDDHGILVFGGAVKGVVRQAAEVLFHGHYWNHTMVKENGWEDKTDDGQVGGCAGSLHRNESDIGIMISNYGTANYDTVDPFALYFEEPLVITSAYNKTNVTRKADVVVTSLKSFTVQLWLMIILSWLVVFSLKIAKRLVNKVIIIRPFLASLKIVCSLKRVGRKYNDSRTLTVTSAIGLFVIVSYYSCLMSTEMFIPEKPFLIDGSGVSGRL